MSKFITYFFLIYCCFLLFNSKLYNDRMRYDMSAYYLYLPAFFIERDLGHLSFYKALDKEYYNSNQYGTFPSNHGKRYIKYPIGVAVFELPFFFIALAFSKIFNCPLLHGYSTPFQIAICLSGILWSFIGLIFLRKFLRLFFSDIVVAFTILLFAFATNLYCYSTYELGMSHPFSFAMYAVLLLATEKYFQTKKLIWINMVALSLGMLVILRPTNILGILIPAIRLFPILLRIKIADGSKLLSTLKAFILFIFPICLQLIYWKYTTDKWLLYSYNKEYFDFTHPHVLDGLFSIDKGWLVYSPVFILCIVGLRKFYKMNYVYFLLTTIFFAINVYVVFSGGFGDTVGDLVLEP